MLTSYFITQQLTKRFLINNSFQKVIKDRKIENEMYLQPRVEKTGNNLV